MPSRTSDPGRRGRRATIIDVARAAGVSTGTVSRSLNGHPDVSPATRERVGREVARLGYRPSASARALIKRAISAVGVLLPDAAHQIFMLELQGIEAVASQHDLAVLLSDSHRQADHELLFADLMAQFAVSGVVLVGGSSRHDREIALRLGGIPAVAAGRRSAVFPAVTIGHRRGARSVVEHLLAAGHRRIGVVRGDPSAEAGAERFVGYREALEAAGLAVDRELVRGGDFTIPTALAATAQLLDLPDRPTAIVYPNDEAALAGLRSIKDHGLRVPEDIAVTGFDDVPAAALLDPPLTTAHTPARELGGLAMQMLAELIGGRGGARQVTLDAPLVVRGSTGGSTAAS